MPVVSQIPPDPDVLLDIRGLSRSFGGLRALDGCTLSLRRGRITGLIGPNGAGKTTLLNVVAGLVAPDGGQVLLDGRPVQGRPPHEMARLGVARTFQIVRELGGLTLFENLMLAPLGQCGESVSGALLRRGRMREQERELARRAQALLRRIGLWRLADQPAGALSGGQKKLLEMARAMMLRPSLILLDEPAAGVAPPLLTEIVALIRELREQGVSFGIVEHNMKMIAEVCDDVHVMAEGRTLVSGSFADVAADPRVVEAYLGGKAA